MAEVYIRRVYRAHTIESVEIKEVDGIMSAHWSFKFSDTPPAESPNRRGFFTVFPSLDAYKAKHKDMVGQTGQTDRQDRLLSR